MQQDEGSRVFAIAFVPDMNPHAGHFDELRRCGSPSRGERAHWAIRRPVDGQEAGTEQHQQQRDRKGRLQKTFHGRFRGGNAQR